MNTAGDERGTFGLQNRRSEDVPLSDPTKQTKKLVVVTIMALLFYFIVIIIIIFTRGTAQTHKSNRKVH